MLTSPHTATGTAIGAVVPNPFIAIPLAIASHYLLDMVPHWQETLAPYTPTPKTYLRLTLDVALSVAIILVIVATHPDRLATIWASGIAANIPDVDSLLVLKPKLLSIATVKRYFDWHCRIQNETTAWFGVWTQLMVIIIALLAVR